MESSSTQDTLKRSKFKNSARKKLGGTGIQAVPALILMAILLCLTHVQACTASNWINLIGGALVDLK
jgi:hypothetical protein